MSSGNDGKWQPEICFPKNNSPHVFFQSSSRGKLYNYVFSCHGSELNSPLPNGETSGSVSPVGFVLFHHLGKHQFRGQFFWYKSGQEGPKWTSSPKFIRLIISKVPKKSWLLNVMNAPPLTKCKMPRWRVCIMQYFSIEGCHPDVNTNGFT